MIVDRPYVSVVIPSYNSETSISQCLESILDQSYPRNSFEVIVVDNASTDNSPEMIKTYPVIFLYEPKKGPSAARNTGIRQAKGEFILFIDADCIAGKDLIMNHIKAHLHAREHDPAIKIVGGAIGGINKNYWAMCDNFCSWYQNNPKLKPRIEERYLPAANLSIDRMIFIKVGLFDEELRIGEDVMFCKMVLENGYKMFFEPKAFLNHINRTSFKNFMRHSKEWAQIGKLIEQKTFKNKVMKNGDRLLTIICKLCRFSLQFFKLSCTWIISREFTFFLCLPFVFINQLYYAFHFFKVQFSKEPSTPACRDNEA